MLANGLEREEPAIVARPEPITGLARRAALYRMRVIAVRVAVDRVLEDREHQGLHGRERQEPSVLVRRVFEPLCRQKNVWQIAGFRTSRGSLIDGSRPKVVSV